MVDSAAVKLRELAQLVQRAQREDRTVSTIVQKVNIYRSGSTVGLRGKAANVTGYESRVTMMVRSEHREVQYIGLYVDNYHISVGCW